VEVLLFGVGDGDVHRRQRHEVPGVAQGGDGAIGRLVEHLFVRGEERCLHRAGVGRSRSRARLRARSS
jgi:hypothetical protein